MMAPWRSDRPITRRASWGISALHRLAVRLRFCRFFSSSGVASSGAPIQHPAPALLHACAAATISKKLPDPRSCPVLIVLYSRHISSLKVQLIKFLRKQLRRSQQAGTRGVQSARHPCRQYSPARCESSCALSTALGPTRTIGYNRFFQACCTGCSCSRPEIVNGALALQHVT